MNSLVRWPGGQSKIAKKIVKILPPHKVYVEPFAGGAAVFWNKAPAEVEVLADGNQVLVRGLDAIRKGGLKGCKPIVQTKAAFESAKAAINDSACAFIRFNRMAFDGSLRESRSLQNDGKVIASTVLRDQEVYAKRLRRTHLRIADFEDTMEKYDSEETVHFLDPPWTSDPMPRSYARKKYGKALAQVSLEKVADVAASMKGSVVITYYDSPTARRILHERGFKLYRVKAQKGGNKLGTGKVGRLIATNFKVKK